MELGSRIVRLSEKLLLGVHLAESLFADGPSRDGFATSVPAEPPS
jgi:hypothetical protein